MTPGTVVCRTIELGNQLIALTSKNVQKYICEWHLDSFINAIFLGAPRKAIQLIASKLGIADQAVDADQILDSIDTSIVQKIPPLKVFRTNCNVTITDLMINNVSGSQRFGIGLKVADNNHIGPVTIDGVALLVTLTPEPKDEARPRSRHD